MDEFPDGRVSRWTSFQMDEFTDGRLPGSDQIRSGQPGAPFFTVYGRDGRKPPSPRPILMGATTEVSWRRPQRIARPHLQKKVTWGGAVGAVFKKVLIVGNFLKTAPTAPPQVTFCWRCGRAILCGRRQDSSVVAPISIGLGVGGFRPSRP